MPRFDFFKCLQFGSYVLYRYICDITHNTDIMNNENNRDYTVKRAVMFFLYTFVGSFTTILALFHFTTGIMERVVESEIIMAVLCGLSLAAVNTFIRIKSGKMGEPIVHMRKYKYWAFTELALFYFFLLLGVIHLFDHEGAYMVEELLLGVFFALFASGVNVLHLIKKEKNCRG